MDVTQLTDVELREALISNGVTVGPIAPSTRKVYEKKLAKITNLNDSQNTSQIIEQLNASKDESTAPVVEEFVFKRVSPQREVPVFEKSPDVAEDERDASDVEDYEGEESMRYLTEEEIAESRASFRQVAAPQKNKLRNFIILAVAFAAIGVFAYFLLENAEVFLVPLKTEKNDSI